METAKELSENAGGSFRFYPAQDKNGCRSNRMKDRMEKANISGIAE